MTRAAIRWIAAAWIPAALSACMPPSAPSTRPPDNRVAPSTPSQPRPSTAVPVLGTVTPMTLANFFPIQQSNTALIYDVRPGFSYRIGHIPGAQSWPKSQFDAQLAPREAEIRSAVAAKRPVILYCTDLSCPDSTKVATRLAALGHSVSILEGGFATWKAADLPTE